MEIARPAGLAALPPGYGPLFDRAAAVFAADGRVRGRWGHGAIGRGQADAGSDLDLSLAIRDEDFDQFAGQWRDWLAAITTTLTARVISAVSLYALTPGCERFDVIAERVSALPGTGLRRRVVVFDRDELTGLIPPPADPPPDRGTVSFLIEETLRQAANFPAVVVREDWLLGVVAVQQIRLFLYELFAESKKPMPPTGPKQWSSKLTGDQRRALEGLPAAAPDPQSVRAARDAALAVFLRDAPTIAPQAGTDW